MVELMKLKNLNIMPKQYNLGKGSKSAKVSKKSKTAKFFSKAKKLGGRAKMFAGGVGRKGLKAYDTVQNSKAFQRGKAAYDAYNT